MSESLERAAQAFDAVAKSEPQAPKGNESGPPERLFGRVGELEVDEDSPEKGGGDDDDEEVIYREEGNKVPKPPRKGEEEPEEGDDDDESDGDDDESEDDEESDEELLSQDVKVIVDGEERTVKLKEALEGYVRTETFHKRMNEVDEARTIVRRAAADAVQNYQYSMNLGQQIEEHLKALVPPEPNWDDEFAKNPTRAREMQRYYDQVKAFRADLNTRLGDAAKRVSESNAVQLQAFADAEAQKFDQSNTRNWSTDPKKKQKDLSAMRRTALTAGFSEEEISQVYDSRMLMVLLKASKYDRMMAAKPKPIQKVREKPISPGAGSARSRTAQRGFSSAFKKLNKSGSIEDAAVVMDEIIRRGG